ncbi:RHO4 protein [Coemansia erecta]|uniref:RHO4 protein n=1 Tax=Coemansia erecta TaxID=147472 RepID=A0A9W8CQV4_9FUNG|nr:RHO4 protein [Coemansia erecta]
MSARQESKPQAVEQRKIVVVGDGASGKTCLLRTFHDKQFPADDSYIPTVFDVSITDMTYNNRQIELALWDTAGQEDYDRLRIMSYPGAHIVLLCFSVDSIESLENAHEKWMPEIKNHAASAKVLLVALKTDLRTERSAVEHMRRVYQRGLLSREEGEEMARYLRIPYAECAAKIEVGVGHVFETAIGLVESSREEVVEDKSCCVIL